MIAKTSTLTPALYLVATPIGNARDITLRALDVLASADVLAAEDTRTLRKIMEIHGISVGDRMLIAYHDHSGEGTRKRVVDRLAAGQSVAYASEAGTPLVADPGYKLALEIVEAGFEVVAIPGASAVLTALSVAGLPSDRFTFAGFAPTAQGARRRFLEGLTEASGTLVFYESPRRVQKFLADAIEVFGAERQGATCRELTKKFEEVRRGTLAELLRDPGMAKGEMVIVIGPEGEKREPEPGAIEDALRRAMENQSLRDAAAEVAEGFGLNKRNVYQMALKLKS